MKFYAPYKTFRVKVGGRVLLFPNGVRNVEESNLKEIAAIKSIPIELGEIRDREGNVVNEPQEVKLKDLTVRELLATAEAHGFDLGKARKKADIVTALTECFEAQAAAENDQTEPG